jgi:hypothetical protein
MRRFGASALTLTAAFVFGSSAGAGSTAGASCARPISAAVARLPAPIVVTTDCGRYRFDRRGRVTYRRGFALPVPPGTTAYFMDLTWYRVRNDHRNGRLTIGHGKRTLWRSRGRHFRDARDSGIGAVVSGRTAVAFSVFQGRRMSLYIARLGQAEQLVATDETPLGFTAAGGLVSERRRTLLLRRGPVWRPRRLSSDAGDVVFDHAAHAVYFVARGRLERFDGARVMRLATLTSLRVGRRPQIEPLGRLVGVHSASRLVVLRPDGRVFASTTLPRPARRADMVSSALAAGGDADAVAFTVTHGNTAYGSRGSEIVYLLRPGTAAARVVFRERLRFAVCERQAELSWRGRWLLYSTSEGHVALVDTSRPAQSADLSETVARLPGMAGEEGRFDASWA